MLTFERFTERTLELLDVEPATPPTPDTGLFDELALDSFQAFQLILVIESLAGVDAPAAALPSMLTLDDAYGYYCALRPGPA